VNVRVIDGATVVLDRRSSRIHQLNESATLIWDLCDGRHVPAQIVQQLQAAYDLDATTAELDVKKTVRQLKGLGLFENVWASK
jgi:hypothetical protein